MLMRGTSSRADVNASVGASRFACMQAREQASKHARKHGGGIVDPLRHKRLCVLHHIAQNHRTGNRQQAAAGKQGNAKSVREVVEA